MASPERIHEGTHYEVIDSVELARRWVYPVSRVRSHVRNRLTDPIPHIRFERYVRFRRGSLELEGWLAEHRVNSTASRKRTRLPSRWGTSFVHPLQINRLRLIEGRGFIYAHASPEQEFDFVFDE